MHFCSVLSRDWKTNIKTVFRIFSLLAIIFTLPDAAAALQTALVRTTDGSVHQIRFQNINVDDNQGSYDVRDFVGDFHIYNQTGDVELCPGNDNPVTWELFTAARVLAKTERTTSLYNTSALAAALTKAMADPELAPETIADKIFYDEVKSQIQGHTFLSKISLIPKSSPVAVIALPANIVAKLGIAEIKMRKLLYAFWIASTHANTAIALQEIANQEAKKLWDAINAGRIVDLAGGDLDVDLAAKQVSGGMSIDGPLRLRLMAEVYQENAERAAKLGANLGKSDEAWDHWLIGLTGIGAFLQLITSPIDVHLLKDDLARLEEFSGPRYAAKLTGNMENIYTSAEFSLNWHGFCEPDLRFVGQHTTYEGYDLTYTVALNSPPDDIATISITSDNPDATVSPEILTFTANDWFKPKTVRVSTVEDADTLTDTVYLTHTATGYGDFRPQRLSTTIKDRRGNEFPQPMGQLGPLALALGDKLRIDLSEYFHDPDDDRLIYSASDEGSEVLDVTPDRTGSWITIRAREIGRARVVAWAIDTGDLEVQRFFTVTVTAEQNNAPLVDRTIPDQILTVGDPSERLELPTYFRDPDDDTLTYTVVSSDPNVAIAQRAGSQFTVWTLNVGNTTVTVRATDTNGLFATQAFNVTVTADETLEETPTQRPTPQGLSVGDSIIVQNTIGLGLNIRSDPWIPTDGTDNRIGRAYDEATGTIRNGTPPDAAGRTWWEVEWDASDKVRWFGQPPTNNRGWSVEAIGAAGLLARRPPEPEPPFDTEFDVPVIDDAIDDPVDTSNQRPKVSTQMLPQNFRVGASPKWRNLSSYFRDPDGDTLTYTAISRNDNIVEAVIVGNSVKITPGDLGTTEVILIARDTGGLTATQSFRVEVQPKLETIPSLPVCRRTPQVRDEIVARARVNDCTKVTEDDLESITRLRINAEGLTTLQQGDFDELRGLEELVLSENSLTTLPEAVFWYLGNLEELSLRNNQFTTLVEDTFARLDSLTYLTLQGNQLTMLQQGAFDDLDALIELDLRDNQLTTLPAGVFKNLSNLEELSLDDNQIAILSRDGFSGLTSLEVLDLDGNPLRTIEAGAFNDLSNLTDLDFNGCPLQTIEAGAFNGLSSLTDLDLGYAQLGRLSRDVFSGLSSLEYLLLEENPLRTIEAGAFNGLSNLTDLNLNDAQLSRLSRDVFSGLSSLKDLNLHGNPLQTIEAGAFNGLSNLTDLNLNDAQLSRLSRDVFSGLSSLKDLDLHGNPLREIEKGAFNGLSNLISLDLDENQLAKLPAGIFSGLSRLERLNLKDNPGTPFSLTLELIRTDNTNPNSPGPATVKVKLAEGAPFDMRIPLSVEKGTLSEDTATLTAGQTESDPITVRRNGTNFATVRLGTAPTIPSGYRGIQMAVGAPLVLFSDQSNRPPVAVGTIPEQTLAVGDAAIVIDISDKFDDADGDTLRYTANSDKRGVVSVSLSDTQEVILAPVGEGRATITVTASDGELTTTQTITITVQQRAQTAQTAGAIYWTDWDTNKIQRANLDGSNVEDLVTTGLGSPYGIALDVAAGKMYWADAGLAKIQRANLNGSNVQNLIPLGLSVPICIALDVAGGKMYWTDRGTGKIQRANLDGSNVEDLVFGVRGLHGIALDVGGGKMYWTDNDAGKIQRANLNGTSLEDLITTGLQLPNEIALDVTGGKMYWADDGTQKIQRANLNGTGVQDLVTTGLNVPVGITLDIVSGKMYWTDLGTRKIQRANLDGANVEDLVTTGLNAPFGIALGTSLTISPLVVAREDVNSDGVVDAQDVVLVDQNNLDLNDDGVSDIADILLVVEAMGNAGGAPAARLQAQHLLTAERVQLWLVEAKLLDEDSPAYRRGILVLEQLLALLAPRETVLLPNYPNPFNPETWIPYQIAEPADVTVHIYATTGHLVRTLRLGHQQAGIYHNRNRAAYWDGRNELGEPIASGLYFYTLSAGHFTATRKMLIRK